MNAAKALPSDVTRALAFRFRSARDEAWDDDQCQVEAAGFFAELRQRGWSANPDADWRRLPPVSTATPDVREAAMADIRAALRAARHPNDPSSTQPESGGSDDQM